MTEYLCSMITKPRLQEFSIAELLSLSSLFGISASFLFRNHNLKVSSDQDYCTHFTSQIESNPFIPVTLPSEDLCQKIASRSVCLDRFSYYISQGVTLTNLVENTMEKYRTCAKTQEIIEKGTPFAFRFDTYNNKLTQEQKNSIIQAFAAVPFVGKVDLSTPDRTFIVSVCKDSYFFGLEIAKSKIKRCSFYNKYKLADREYLGPTTTDIELALLMVNQAQVVENSFVLDPFVGTGGILLAASHFGGICYGGDIDMRVLKGLGVGRSTKNTQADIFSNFKNYGFKRPEIFRCDNSNPCLRQAEFFDAIICDPPYGVRAASRKAQKRSTEIYDSKGVFNDLIEFADRVLRIGGRLVFLLPTERESYDPKNLPRHPMFRVVGNTENVLSRKISRRLITMEKMEMAVEVEGGEDKVFYEGIRSTWFRKEMR